MKRTVAIAALALTLAACGSGGGDNLQAGIKRYNAQNPNGFSQARLKKVDASLLAICKEDDKAFPFSVAAGLDKDHAMLKEMRVVCPKRVAKTIKDNRLG